MVTNKKNPYIAGAALRGEEGFFGRSDIIEWVRGNLHQLNSNALVLSGQRRIGKTSLLLQLRNKLSEEGLFPVYFDLQDCAEIPLGEVLADLADTIAEGIDIPLPETALFDNRGSYFRRRFLPQLYEHLGPRRRPVFLFDEFDILDKGAETKLPHASAAKSLFPFLRRIMTEEALPAFVFVIGRDPEDLSLNYSATFKTSLYKDIWVLDPISAEALVRQAEANGTLRFSDDAIHRILDITRCHPYLTQLLCQRLWEQSHIEILNSIPAITAEDVERAVPEALETGDNALSWLWDGLSPAEKIYAAALAKIADEGGTISEDQVIEVLTAHAERLRIREVELAPSKMVKRRVLDSVEDRKYRFAVEMLRRWIRKSKPLREVKDELDRLQPLADKFYTIGQASFLQHKWEDALDSFKRSLVESPQHFRARVQLGETLLELMRADEAVAELERAYLLDPSEARLPLARGLVLKARKCLENGNEADALESCRIALELSPNEKSAQEVYKNIWGRRGDKAVGEGNLNKATAAYEKAEDWEKIGHVRTLKVRRRLLGSSQALILGFGGTGAHILSCLKEQAILKYGSDRFRFLLFDTIADWQPGETVKILGGSAEEKLAQGREAGTSLDPNTEYFFLGDRDPDLGKHVYEYLAQAGNHDRLPHLKDWLHAPWLSLYTQRSRLNILEGAAQQRQIGRFAMFQNAEAIVQQVRTEIKRLRQSMHSWGAINVWLVSSSAGGTGAGCLLDAAFLTRLAARDEKVNITGLVVLPEVYSDMDGISLGRAYSLFRELDRFQEWDFHHQDRFWEDGRDISSRVGYDSRGRYVSEVTGRLFDNLFYVGRPCHSDSARTSFFTSVANAIDPFLDEVSGPTLLEAALNEYAVAAAFGGARLYVPVETLGALFAWQEVDAYLAAATAARREDKMVTGLHFGAAEDRRRDGRSKVENVLPLFKELLRLTGQKNEELRRFARRLDPQSIVKEWYGFGGAAVSGMELTPVEEQLARLTYVNPYFSTSAEDSSQVTVQDLVTRTYHEHKKADRPKESKLESRDRFAAELEAVTQRYKSLDAAADLSFEKGRRVVFDKLSRHLRQRIDETLLRELEQNPRFGHDPEAPEEGTVMTRLYQELNEILADQGPLSRLDAIVSIFFDALDGEELRHLEEASRAVKDLKEWRTAGFFGGNVNEPQEEAREAATAYVETYQRTRLLRDVQSVVRDVKARFQDWANVLRGAFDDLAADVSRSGYAEASVELRRLNARLHRLAQNPTARFSCSPDWDPVAHPDLEMQGYREKLHQECVTDDDAATLAARALSGSSWELAVDSRGRPEAKLKVVLAGREECYDGSTLSELHHALYQHFRATIDERIAQRDIFDYLHYVQQRSYNVNPEKIAQILNDGASALINAEAPEFCRLVCRVPVEVDKRNLTAAILRAIESSVRSIDVAESPHSDPHSITLLKIKKPNFEDIDNITECRDDYIRWQKEQKSDNEDCNKKLRLAQVYHPFRQELEAWYIERHFFQTLGEVTGQVDHIPPRIVRLLEDPAMMQSFVRCVATGAVEKCAQSWVWHNSTSGEDVTLTDADVEPEADLVRAAVIFTLQQREGRRTGKIRIDLEEARQSAVAAAQAHGKTPEEVIGEFLEGELGRFLDEHFSGKIQLEVHRREVAGLRMIFEFYGHPSTRTSLTQRLDLR